MGWRTTNERDYANAASIGSRQLAAQRAKALSSASQSSQKNSARVKKSIVNEHSAFLYGTAGGLAAGLLVGGTWGLTTGLSLQQPKTPAPVVQPSAGAPSAGSWTPGNR